MTVGRAERTFVAWPIPASLGIATGALAYAASVPIGIVLAGVAAAVAAMAWARHRDVLASPLLHGAMTLLLLIPVGWVRHAQRDARPETLAPLVGRTVELAGRSGGRLLRVHGLGGEAVVLRSAGPVPRGDLRVRGTLQQAEEARTPGGFDERGWLR
ncbi:MAG: hypothetical protein WD336_09815, partial [Trueperaceae bacterium]